MQTQTLIGCCPTDSMLIFTSDDNSVTKELPMPMTNGRAMSMCRWGSCTISARCLRADNLPIDSLLCSGFEDQVHSHWVAWLSGACLVNLWISVGPRWKMVPLTIGLIGPSESQDGRPLIPLRTPPHIPLWSTLHSLLIFTGILDTFKYQGDQPFLGCKWYFPLHSPSFLALIRSYVHILWFFCNPHTTWAPQKELIGKDKILLIGKQFWPFRYIERIRVPRANALHGWPDVPSLQHRLAGLQASPAAYLLKSLFRGIAPGATGWAAFLRDTIIPHVPILVFPLAGAQVHFVPTTAPAFLHRFGSWKRADRNLSDSPALRRNLCHMAQQELGKHEQCYLSTF